MEALASLIEQARDGRIQVPEFQRAVRAEDSWIRSLLASVSLGYPIGALSLLDAGNPDYRFAATPLVDSVPPGRAPERLLIDGRHRLTSLVQVLGAGGRALTYDASSNPIERWYFIDIDAALDPGTDRDNAIRSSLRTVAIEAACKRRHFPFGLVFDADFTRWRAGIGDADLVDRFVAAVVEPIRSFAIPTIGVGRDRTRWSVRVHGGAEGPSLSDRYRAE